MKDTIVFYIYAVLRIFDLHSLISGNTVNNNIKIVSRYFKDLHHVYFLWLFGHRHLNIDAKDIIIKNINSISNEDLYVASYCVFTHHSIINNKIDVEFTKEYIKRFDLKQLESFDFTITRQLKDYFRKDFQDILKFTSEKLLEKQIQDFVEKNTKLFTEVYRDLGTTINNAHSGFPNKA